MRARNRAVAGNTRVMVKRKTKRYFAGIGRDAFRYRLYRFITMLRGSIVTGVVLLTLFRNPAQDLCSLRIAYLASPVQCGITRRRHGVVLHHPLNFIQIALRTGLSATSAARTASRLNDLYPS